MIKWMIGTLVVLVVMLCVFVKVDPNINQTTSGGDNISLSEIEEGNKVSVKIEGQVVRPGVYTIEDDATIGDLIEKAGGLLASADKNAINEAVSLGGRTLIYIPKISGYSDVCVVEDAKEKVNINEASAETLSSINGISLALGQKIVAYRNENGDFETIEDIQKVGGIGEKTYEKIRDYIQIK